MKKIIVTLTGLFSFILVFTECAAAQQVNNTYQAGQKVEAYNVGWYKATILEIGSGDKAGYIKVHYDDYSSASDQYLRIASIRTAKTVTVGNTGAGPRNGKYIILSYGGNPRNPIILGYFNLNSGKYSYSDAGMNQIGKGTYSYDAASKKVSWQTGRLAEYNPTAAFSITREGKTHNISLRYGTYASNSTDSR